MDLMFSCTIDATLGVFDESDVLAWPKVPVGPLKHAHDGRCTIWPDIGL